MQPKAEKLLKLTEILSGGFKCSTGEIEVSVHGKNVQNSYSVPVAPLPLQAPIPGVPNNHLGDHPKNKLVNLLEQK